MFESGIAGNSSAYYSVVSVAWNYSNDPASGKRKSKNNFFGLKFYYLEIVILTTILSKRKLVQRTTIEWIIDW